MGWRLKVGLMIIRMRVSKTLDVLDRGMKWGSHPTFILRSLRARRPASVQIALMSAPESSSWADCFTRSCWTGYQVNRLLSCNLWFVRTFDMTYSSRSTSSAKVIFPEKKKFIFDRNLPWWECSHLCEFRRFCAWSFRLGEGTRFSWKFHASLNVDINRSFYKFRF